MRATYRVQLNAAFGFDDAAAIVDYLADLGISHLYCSPYLQAAPGSTHGYDVVDPQRLNDELGGSEAHARLTAALAGRGMSQILDIVPNHMAVAGRANAWWWDVLENGPASRYATYFDIDWDPPERKLIAQVLVPILGDHYGRVLENGELQLVREGGSFVIRYHEHDLPVSPRSLDELVARAAERLRASGSPVADEVASIATALGRLPHALLTDRASVEERHRDKEVLRNRLEALAAEHPDAAVAIDEEVKAVNEDDDALHSLLERQNYRLAFWRTAGRELDYRRFFDITNLVALRAEDEQVFEDTHALIIELVRSGAVGGLRIDHVDGLRDPAEYLARLRSAVGPDTYLVVEKILEGDERLRRSWPVDGTTGYDFLAQTNALLHDRGAEAAITAAYRRFTGQRVEFDEVAYAAKHEVMRTVLVADIERLTERFSVAAEANRRHRDYTRSQLRDALRETLACMRVYRTYVRRGHEPAPEDVDAVTDAIDRAMTLRPNLDPELFRFLGDLLLLRYEGETEAELAERFQQVSAPVMAKGVEDTAFYRFARLVSLNEVGGNPGRFGIDDKAYDQRRVEAVGTATLLASSTHDNKRSEDVRSRLAVLSEIPDAWDDAVDRWSQTNERYRRDGWPDRAAEYLFYQTVVGAWPLPAPRAKAYMEKATKEAKVHTSWIDPVAAYDEAIAAFVESTLGDPEFVAGVEQFLADHDLIDAGRRNSVVQTALKLTMPGVPDIYQGTELWDLSLVDPDNRRPVDYDARRARLAAVRDADAEAILADSDSGAPKLWLIHRLLVLRTQRPEVFDRAADYTPLVATGPDRERVVAYTRGGALAVVAPRLPLAGAFDARTRVTLPHGKWASVLGASEFDGGETAVADLVAEFPVAVLTRNRG
jgi:(1->4)-alpha-D-glucan 1-alpha-D-glucosylmutase